MSEKPVKPNIKFLRKVERGEVQSVMGYTMRRGGYHRFIGGEKAYRDHMVAGYVNPAPAAGLGRPGIVTLTEAGRQALGAAATRDT